MLCRSYIYLITPSTTVHFLKKINKVVDTFTKVIPLTNTSDIREFTAGVRHEFQVTATLKIDGELYEGEKSVAVTLVFGES